MKNLIMCKWLPWSWKTTRSKKEVLKSNWKTKRINKDDLRSMLDACEYSKPNEKNILKTRDTLIKLYAEQWYNIIIDDTNLAPYHEENLKEMASHLGLKFTIKEFNVPVDVCVTRDENRLISVGKDVIFSMYNKFVCKDVIPNTEWKKVIFDIDWTLARMDGRSPYDYTAVDTDLPVQQVIKMLHLLSEDHYDIVICTWRNAVCKEETEQRLLDNNIFYSEFYIRAADDTRKDYIVKKEFLEKIWKENVFAVFDDRPQVLRMRRDEWLFVFNVWSGREF